MILLVVSAILGAAVSAVTFWSFSPLLALSTAPFAGSLAALCAGVALHLARPAGVGAGAIEIDTDGMVAALRDAARRGRERPADGRERQADERVEQRRRAG